MNEDQNMNVPISNQKNKKLLIAGAVIILIIVGSFFLGKQTSAPTTDESDVKTETQQETSADTKSSSVQKTPTSQPKTPTSQNDSFGSGQVNTLGKQPVVLVTLTDNGFAPLSLQVEVGQPVSFTNQSSSGMWVASDPHPSHTGYAGFDQNKIVFRGESYEFTFNKAGTWKYHNHINPSQKGTIIVK